MTTNSCPETTTGVNLEQQPPDEPVFTAGPEEAARENARLKRLLARREHDLITLTGLYAHTARLCQIYEQEKNLRLAYNKLLLRHTPNLVYVLDNELRFVLGSRSAMRLTGTEPDRLRHKLLSHIFDPRVSPEWVAKIRGQCLEVLHDQRLLQYDDTIIFDGLEIIFVQTNVRPILDEKGELHGVLVILINLSELVEAKRRAEDGARAKSDFLANMSHEIRTPLNSIKGFGEILAGTRLDDRQRVYLDHALGAVDTLIGLIDDVLDFSKIDAGKMEITAAPYNLPRLIRDICNLIVLRADQKDLRLLADIDPNLPVSLIGDEAHLRQILTNLLSNAVKYTPSGHVKFILRTENRAGRLFLIVTVHDTGLGIKPEEIPHLFKAFTRADLRANRNISGTGLGLAISRHLALAMGGNISVHSLYGQGSRFTLEIPQEVNDARPICRLDDSWRGRVLLLGTDRRLENAADMLSALGVEFFHLRADLAGTEALDQAELTARIQAAGTFTHALHTEKTAGKPLFAVKDGLGPDCRFGELRSLRNPLVEGGRSEKETIIFNPLLITDLVDFLQPEQPAAGSGEGPDALLEGRFTTHGVVALAVDDHELNLLVCEEFLQEYGIEVVRAASGPEALRLCQEQRFDIIFLDHMMPHMDGVEVAHRLRNGGLSNKNTPLVALTANVVNNMRDYYLKNGLDDMIGKPIDRAILARVLLKLLPPAKVEMFNH
ncbi:MAG: response regulator [Candidatus Adiutrix sp.]|jgi:signal transduction histidine kinase/CheY-like chemotaxis protein|nr:response regulator [Candidatus Adiutrix sp.]